VNKYKTVDEIFKEPGIRSVGIIADINQGKSNVIYAALTAIQKHCKNPSIYTYGLVNSLEGVQSINSVEELEKIHDSVVFIDEFPNLFSLSNKRQVEMFEKSMRLVFQREVNNVVVICGLAHNFNKFLGGLLQIMIFKQLNLVDLIQRSPTERVIASYSNTLGSRIQKGSRVLAMPKDTALIYDTQTGHYYETIIPYVPEMDSKLGAKPILHWLPIEIKKEK
jgi:hypothetical protein